VLAETSIADICARVCDRLPQFSWPGDWPDSPQLTPASVLVPLIARPEGVQLLLTRRTDHLQHHAGQISFPGGHQEADDRSAIDTALREAREEVGIQDDKADVLGAMPELATPSGFRITPVIAVLSADIELHPDPREVAECFEVPLMLVLNPASYQAHRLLWQGKARPIYALPFHGRFIWGATALILYRFMHLICDTKAAK
jgi:8-oxo-dGTP pyrophosphatase MutT (NUDIX family)